MTDIKYKETTREKANYAIIYRPVSSDTTVIYYETLEAVKWALKNSWFDPKEALPVKLLEWKPQINETTPPLT